MRNQRRRSGPPPGRTCRTAARSSAGGSVDRRRRPRGAVDGRSRVARRPEHRPARGRRRHLRPGQLGRGRRDGRVERRRALALRADRLQHRALRRRGRRRRGCTPSTGPTGVVALDRADGRPSCGRPMSRPPPRPASTSSRCVAGGLVLVELRADQHRRHLHAGGDRGVVDAPSTPRPATVRVDLRHRLGDDLWGDPEVNSGGGAWYPPAVDLERGARLRRHRQPGAVPRHRRVTRTARAGRATTSTPTRSSPSTSPPASCSGTTR